MGQGKGGSHAVCWLAPRRSGWTTSTGAIDFASAPTSLGTVFDLFVLDRSETVDTDILEAAASQSLLLTGFLGAQLRHRYSLAWYARLRRAFLKTPQCWALAPRMHTRKPAQVPEPS